MPIYPKFLILLEGDPVIIARKNLKNVMDIQYKEL